jgi:hypothetical protein
MAPLFVLTTVRGHSKDNVMLTLNVLNIPHVPKISKHPRRVVWAN